MPERMFFVIQVQIRIKKLSIQLKNSISGLSPLPRCQRAYKTI